MKGLEDDFPFDKNGDAESKKLGGGFKHFLFSPRNLGKISNLTNIFQMGWNHQPEDFRPGQTQMSNEKKTWLVGLFWGMKKYPVI